MPTETGSGRPRRVTRMGAVAVLTWVLAVVVGGAIAWRALGVVDSGERTGVMSQSQVTAALAAARPAVTSSPPATPAPTPAPQQTASATPPPASTAAPPTEVARTWTVAGGVVAVSCSGGAITLLYATPSDGWTVEVGSPGPERVEVELRRDKAKTELSGTCVAGVPEAAVDAQVDGGGSGSDGRGSTKGGSSGSDG